LNGARAHPPRGRALPAAYRLFLAGHKIFLPAVSRKFLTLFLPLAYSLHCPPRLKAGRSFKTMRNARFFYFSFTYRFSFVEGGEDGSVRAKSV
jgi:hypothetical protein